MSENKIKLYLRETSLTGEFKEKAFPTAPWTTEYLKVHMKHTGVTLGYIGWHIQDSVAHMHIYVYPKYRTSGYIESFIELYNSDFIPLMKEKAHTVCVTCPYENHAMKNFFKRFGFNPEAHWCAYTKL